jgi:ribonuclease Z
VKKLILTHFSARYQEEIAFEKEAREVFPNSFAARDFARFEFPKDVSTTPP